MNNLGFTWKHLAAASIALIVITGAPYLYAYINTPPGGAYTGLHALTPGDFNVYFAQMRQAAEGTLSTHDLFSGKEGSGSISMMNPLWWSLGKLGGALHISPVLMFHLARLFLIPIFLFVLWQLIVVLIPERFRLLSGAVVLLSSGIGYFLYPFVPHTETPEGVYAFPMDLWVPESNTFLTLSHSPHLLFALILFLFALNCFIRAHAAVRPFSWQVGGGLAVAALFSFHPFHLPTLGAILVGWTCIYGRKAWRRSFETLFVFTALGAPSVGWQIGRLLTDEITLDWARQIVTLTPPFWDAAAGFGLLLPLAVFGMVHLKRVMVYEQSLSGARAVWLLAFWLVAQLALVYSPLAFQRRLLHGLHVPFAILAAVGMAGVIEYMKRTPLRARQAITVGIWLVLFSSTLGTVSRDVALFSVRDPHMYLSPALATTFTWLEDKQGEGVVLAGLTTASFVPPWTGRLVYAVPGAHSLRFDVERRVRAFWFLLGKGTERQRRDFLVRENITDIVIAPFDSIDTEPLIHDPLLRLQFVQEGVYWFVPKNSVSL